MEKNINNLINNVYNNVINNVLSGIDQKYNKAICQEYINTLNKRYSTYPVNDENYDLLLNRIIELEKAEWAELQPGVKLHIFLKDEALDKIIDLSGKALELAKDYIDNNKMIDDNTYNQIITNYPVLFEKVADYNKKLAEWYIIEGTSDLDFAAGKRKMPSSRLDTYEKKTKNTR